MTPIEKLLKAHRYADKLATNSWGSYEAGLFMGLTIALEIMSPSEKLANWIKEDVSFADFMKAVKDD